MTEKTKRLRQQVDALARQYEKAAAEPWSASAYNRPTFAAVADELRQILTPSSEQGGDRS